VKEEVIKVPLQEPKRMSKEMALYIYIDYVDSMLTRLSVSLTAIRFYFLVTPYCEDKSCYTDAMKYYTKVHKLTSKLTDIKVDFCSGLKKFRETLRDLTSFSKLVVNLQRELKRYYERCEPYCIPYAETRKGWPIPIETSGQEIERIRDFIEDTTFEEFAYGNWKEAISSLLEYYSANLPGHIDRFKKYALESCPILRLTVK